MKKIFIGAGEASSDKIAASILKAMPKEIEFTGITGIEMKKQNINTLFDIKDISFIGLDILANLHKILQRIDQTVEWIEKNEPEFAIFVDAYDFYIRIAKKLKKRGCKTKIVAVVAPLAWLYSHNKVYKVAKYFDKLICIFPFEPDFFSKNGHQDVHFFGNPFLENIAVNVMPRDKNLILITVGSRNNEVVRHVPIVKKVIENIRQSNPNINIFMPTTETTHEYIIKEFKNIKNIEFSCDENIKDLKMRTAYFAIAKSGTNNNEMAARGLPFLVYYKVGWLSYMIGKFLLKIKLINMVNIVANKMIIPEIIQVKASPKEISDCFLDFYNNPDKITKQNQEVAQQMDKMRGNFGSNFGRLTSGNILS